MPTTITDLPPYPNREEDGEEDFAAKALAYTAAMSTFIVEANAQAGENNDAAADAAASALTAINAPGTQGTSTSSVGIGSGTKSFATQTGKAWVVGMFIVAAATADVANWMHGQITSYNSGTGALVLSVVGGNFEGTGTFTDWSLSLAPPASLGKAEAADIWAGSSDALAITPESLLLASKSVGVAFGSTVTLDLEAGQRFHFTAVVSSNFALANPTNMEDGRMIILRGVIDGTGNRTMTVGNKWKFPGGAPDLPTAAGSRFRIIGEVTPDGTEIEATLIKGYA